MGDDDKTLRALMKLKSIRVDPTDDKMVLLRFGDGPEVRMPAGSMDAHELVEKLSEFPALKRKVDEASKRLKKSERENHQSVRQQIDLRIEILRFITAALFEPKTATEVEVLVRKRTEYVGVEEFLAWDGDSDDEVAAILSGIYGYMKKAGI